MNKAIFLSSLLCFSIGITLIFIFTNTYQQEPSSEIEKISFTEHPYLDIPVIDAYYEGQKMWFIHTDVSDSQMSQRLTNMVNFNTIYAAELGKMSTNNMGKLYIFTNGIKQIGIKPWDGGPFNYQIDIFDSIPGMKNYTPLRNPHLVTWQEGATPRILKSVTDLMEAQKNNELTIKQTDVIVNVPIVHWPSSYLDGQSKIK